MVKIGFIGCGNMASAMIGGILEKGLYPREEIIVSNKTKEGAARSAGKFGVKATLDNREVAQGARVLILSVKPQFYEEVLTQISPCLTSGHLLVGIAPGKTIQWLKEHCTGQVPSVARMMPNTPAMVGEGMTAIAAEDDVDPKDLELLCTLAQSIGISQVIPERLMDAAGAVGGCSPAFVYLFIEALADAGVAEGMPRPMAYRFAAQAVLGSARMLLETGKHPGELKDMVTSPGGTTIQGIRALEKYGMRSAVFEAVAACVEKGKTL